MLTFQIKRISSEKGLNYVVPFFYSFFLKCEKFGSKWRKKRVWPKIKGEIKTQPLIIRWRELNMTRNRPPKLVLFICICMYYKAKGQIPLGSWENKTHKLKRSVRDISALSLRHL